jgi:hypothetical protein
MGYRGLVFVKAGRIDEARKLLAAMQEFAQERYVLPSSMALAFFALGEIDKGFDWLEKAVEERDSWILHLRVDPFYDPIRAHPRYQAVLRKMNLQ